MLIIDVKYLVRPIDRDMAIHNFKYFSQVLGVNGNEDGITEFKLFMPKYHTLKELENWGNVNSKWYADWN